MPSTWDPSGQRSQPVLVALVDIVKSIEEFDQAHPELRDADTIYGTRLEELAEGGQRLYLKQEDREGSYIEIPPGDLLHEENDGIAVAVWVRANQPLRYVRAGSPDQFLAGDELRDRLSADMGEGTACEELVSEVEEVLSAHARIVITQVGKKHTKRYYLNSEVWERPAPYKEA